MTISGPIFRRAVLALLLTCLAAAGLSFGFAGRRSSAPSLDGLAPLLAAGRFEEIETRLRAFLAVQPDHAQANMLMAQVALARVDQKPALALESLRRVRVSTRDALAIVRLNEGKAYSGLGRQNLAEDAWRDALRLAPHVP